MFADETPPMSPELAACLYATCSLDEEVAAKYARAAVDRRQVEGLGIFAMALFNNGDVEMGRKLAELAVRRGERNERLLSFVATENMRRGNFEEGARLWAIINSQYRLPGIRAWEGEPIAGKTVLIASGSPLLARNASIGFGDEVLYARVAPELAKRGAQVYLRTPPALLRLFESLSGVTPIEDVSEIAERADYCANPAELAAWLAIARRENLPAGLYLRAEAVPIETERLKVGISWGCGDQGPTVRYLALSELSKLAGIPGVQLYSLDKTRHAAQLYPPPQGMNVIDLARGFNDFADTAAAIMAMDVIVSADNVIANLAGALGQRLFALCPSTPEYRWGDGENTPWYSSARVFRQAKPGDWRGAVAEVADEIRRLVAKKCLFGAPVRRTRAALSAAAEGKLGDGDDFIA